MTPDQLHYIGEALYGPHYKAALANGLGVSHRTIDRWLTGRFRIPYSTEAKLVKICLDQLVNLDELARQRRETLSDLLDMIEG